jgi:hypothetical protein
LVLGCGGGGSGAGPGGGGGGAVPTSVNLTSSAVKVPFPGTITLSAVVNSSKNPTGTIIFWEQNNGGALAPTVALVNGKAQATVSLTLVGTHQVYAQYSGDAQNQASQSANLNIVATGSAFLQLSGTTASLTHNIPYTVVIQ